MGSNHVHVGEDGVEVRHDDDGRIAIIVLPAGRQAHDDVARLVASENAPPVSRASRNARANMPAREKAARVLAENRDAELREILTRPIDGMRPVSQGSRYDNGTG